MGGQDHTPKDGYLGDKWVSRHMKMPENVLAWNSVQFRAALEVP